MLIKKLQIEFQGYATFSFPLPSLLKKTDYEKNLLLFTHYSAVYKL